MRFADAAKAVPHVQRLAAASAALVDAARHAEAPDPVFTYAGQTFRGDDAKLILGRMAMTFEAFCSEARQRLRELGVVFEDEGPTADNPCPRSGAITPELTEAVRDKGPGEAMSRHLTKNELIAMLSKEYPAGVVQQPADVEP